MAAPDPEDPKPTELWLPVEDVDLLDDPLPAPPPTKRARPVKKRVTVIQRYEPVDWGWVFRLFLWSMFAAIVMAEICKRFFPLPK